MRTCTGLVKPEATVVLIDASFQMRVPCTHSSMRLWCTQYPTNRCGYHGRMATNKPQDDYQKQGVRIPKALHARIHEAAAASGRSYNSELIARLEASFALPATAIDGVALNTLAPGAEPLTPLHQVDAFTRYWIPQEEAVARVEQKLDELRALIAGSADVEMLAMTATGSGGPVTQPDETATRPRRRRVVVTRPDGSIAPFEPESAKPAAPSRRNPKSTK